jgi:hypothetical protein
MSNILKVGILTSVDGDPVVQRLCLWLLHMGHNPILIYEHDLHKNKSIKIDVNTDFIGVNIHCNDGNHIVFDEIDVFFRRSWHHALPFSVNEDEHYKAQELYALRNYIL